MATAVATRKNTLPANWEKLMAADAARGKKAVASIGVGQFMSIRGGILTFAGSPVPGNKMQAVVLAAIPENAYYKEEFDEKNPTPPNCYAFGNATDVDEPMVPHAEAEDKQHSDCGSCRWNKFGTAEKGRGKACKNSFRLSIMHADSLKQDIAQGFAAYLKVPPTSLPGWAAHVRNLEQMNKPTYAFITEISVVPDIKSQYKVLFQPVKQITDKKLLGQVFARAKEMEKVIAFPYQPIDTSSLGGKKKRKK